MNENRTDAGTESDASSNQQGDFLFQSGSFIEFHAKTLTGLEPVLAAEVATLGGQGIATEPRLVVFHGDQRLLYRANRWSRTAIRILQPIHRFEAASEADLYAGVASIEWTKHLDPNQSLAVDATVRSSFCTHSLYAAQLVKDAVVDQLRTASGARPSVDLKDPDVRIGLHLRENRATLYLDSSNQSLHKRGYRAEAGRAPLSEVLAAGIVQLSGWDRLVPFVDPMCGSGTLAIEAAMLARNIAPGSLGRPFGYQKWKDYDASLDAEIEVELSDSVRSAVASIIAVDRDPAAIERAKINAARAGVADAIRFEVGSIESFVPPAPPAVVVANPPYDERLEIDDARAFHRRLGDALKRNYAGYRAFIFTGHGEAAKQIGLRSKRRIVLYNGPIECRLLEFDLYAGSQKQPRIDPETGVPVAKKPAPPARWADQIGMFSNRLARMDKHWSKWARRQGITCFRVYDRDVPTTPVAIDRYENWVHVAEYDRPSDRSEEEHARWRREVRSTISAVLNVPHEHIVCKFHERQPGPRQYGRQAEAGRTIVAKESGLSFEVNLFDYLDTGLFLDHRIVRGMIREQAAGKCFLNLFGYTGSATVCAAAGGAASTVTVDLSPTYLAWAKRNLERNRFGGDNHAFVESDVFAYLDAARKDRRQRYDLAFVGPPTFSNSKRMRDVFDLNRDHVRLIDLTLEVMMPDGVVYFTTGARTFRFREDEIAGASIREITTQTVPPDFGRKKSHRCWRIIKN